jgi:hypothetical protein
LTCPLFVVAPLSLRRRSQACCWKLTHWPDLPRRDALPLFHCCVAIIHESAFASQLTGVSEGVSSEVVPKGRYGRYKRYLK